MKLVHSEIAKYVLERRELRLQTCKSELMQLQAQTKELQKIIDTLNNRIETMSKEFSQIQITQRNISDNLQLRQFKKDKISLDQQIEKLKFELARCNYASLQASHKEARNQYDSAVMEKSSLIGAIQQLREHRGGIERNLRDYRNVDQEFMEKKYRYMAEDLAMNDLEKYAKALEEAIQKFHSLKMIEINKIIRELWTKTYKGLDIDTIEIRSEPESKTNSKSFHYRVCKDILILGCHDSWRDRNGYEREMLSGTKSAGFHYYSIGFG
jgi:DNA repair protein RAD50